ncbi:MAG: zinc ribbon domain-containing protein [Candidatus Zixiibacteriota bacterium]
MPLHEFRCQSCGRVFEKLVRTSDDTSKLQCPECSSTEVTKLFSAFATSGSSGSSSCSSGSLT